MNKYYINKKIFFIIFGFCFILVAFIIKNSIIKNTTKLSPIEISTKNINDNVVFETQYNNLLASFTNSSEEYNYPYYYAGSYFDSLENKLVVLITDINITNKNDLMNRIGSNDFIIQLADYSLIDLEKTMNIIDKYDSGSFNKNIPKFTAWSIEEDKNRIIVLLEDCNNEQISLFKEKVIDSDMIEYRSGVFTID